MRQEIADKIAPLINHVEDKPITRFNITRQEIIESITKNAVTNTWSDTPQSNRNQCGFRHEYTQSILLPLMDHHNNKMERWGLFTG